MKATISFSLVLALFAAETMAANVPSQDPRMSYAVFSKGLFQAYGGSTPFESVEERGASLSAPTSNATDLGFCDLYLKAMQFVYPLDVFQITKCTSSPMEVVLSRTRGSHESNMNSPRCTAIAPPADILPYLYAFSCSEPDTVQSSSTSVVAPTATNAVNSTGCAVSAPAAPDSVNSTGCAVSGPDSAPVNASLPAEDKISAHSYSVLTEMIIFRYGGSLSYREDAGPTFVSVVDPTGNGTVTDRGICDLFLKANQFAFPSHEFNITECTLSPLNVTLSQSSSRQPGGSDNRRCYKEAPPVELRPYLRESLCSESALTSSVPVAVNSSDPASSASSGLTGMVASENRRFWDRFNSRNSVPAMIANEEKRFWDRFDSRNITAAPAPTD
jgi:hypothetical protein